MMYTNFKVELNFRWDCCLHHCNIATSLLL